MKPVSLSLAGLSTWVGDSAGGKLDASIIGPDVQLSGVASLLTATRSDLSFLSNPRYRADASKSNAGAIVLNATDHAELLSEKSALPTVVVCQQPYAWFAFAAQRLNPVDAGEPGIRVGAHVADSARVHATARVNPGVTIGAGAVIDEGASIGAGSTIGARVVIGAGTRIHPHVTVLDDCRIGQRCIVHSGAVIGSDGFGFAPFDGRWIKIPQIGAVVIGDDVEIGANTTIDRGAMGDTIIEDGVKLDNQIQIAHNCVIGAHTVIAACVGIAGSAKIGRRCRIGGAAMIAGHLTVADGTDIGPATVVVSSLESGHYTAFFPLMKQSEWERTAAVIRRLPDLRSRLRRLESGRDAEESPEQTNVGETK
ncbi:MAG: UDP-3-O-(3-hydroxymyristoyl)glucosamine N-acyltransferase [Burkholderiaceae bacterium]|nr:UDP-3-O-(3-hydroxymyristoyl)glucosamine N-acyltransferase [Burkholderiaceae bacterium]